MRKQPDWVPATPPLADGQPHIHCSDGTKMTMITQTREYQLITPLFGGGVEPARADPITVVRAAEIRGQLRFWWRATRGGRCNGNLKLLKQEEDAIWGSAASTGKDKDKAQGGPSRVWVEVIIRDKGQPDKPFEVIQRKIQPRKGSIVPAYAAFPLQPTEAEVKKSGAHTDIKSVSVGIVFTLKVTYPAPLLKDIEAALWAWETFGGLGARTRRGFGALRLVRVDGQPYNDLPPSNLEQAQKWLQAKLQQHVVEGTWPDNVPHLQRRVQDTWLRIKHQHAQADQVWLNLINALKKFRQSRRDKEGKRSDYGHSDWPEANAIRRKVRVPARGPHAQRQIDAAPRGAFGLPIVFHFKDADDPDDMVLQIDAKKDRFASPLILKPLACRDGAVGLAVVLQGSCVPADLVLKSQSGQTDAIMRQITQQEAAQIPPLNGNPDVLQAFLKTL